MSPGSVAPRGLLVAALVLELPEDDLGSLAAELCAGWAPSAAFGVADRMHPDERKTGQQQFWSVSLRVTVGNIMGPWVPCSQLSSLESHLAGPPIYLMETWYHTTSTRWEHTWIISLSNTCTHTNIMHTHTLSLNVSFCELELI